MLLPPLTNLPRLVAESERAKAAQGLEDALRAASDPAEQEGLRRALAQIRGTPPLRSQARVVWTRIANACTSTPPSP